VKNRILNECLTIAFKNNNPIKHPQWDCYKHYSFVIQNHKIVEWGTNRRGSSFTFLGYEPYQKIHSEVDAYFKARGIMDKGVPFEVVNIRLTKNGTLRDSNPCKCCFAFLRNLGCKAIWFSTDLENFASLRF